jgi:hypothetical protein
VTAAGFSILSVLLVALVFAPRRWAALALLMGALYVTRGQVLELGPANLTVPRLLVLAGFARVVLRGERISNGLHAADWLVALWAIVLIATSAAHTSDAWIYRSGVILTELGCYLLFRVLLQDLSDVRFAFKGSCLAMIPLAALVLVEKHTGHNFFGFLGGVNVVSMIRDGNFRAAGPFAHPILAGTVGAACMGMAAALWRSDRFAALCGVLAGGGVVYACASSGPVLMVVAIVVALIAWHAREHMRLVQGTALVGILALSVVMKDPVYFLVARIDITGGSQGYFRAQLIRSSIEHFSEWWLAGTDYTRHWMASGIYANTIHTDITNHLLWMGVLGGLPLLLAFVALLICAFRDVGRGMRAHALQSASDRFVIWTLGALLFGFFTTFWSISLFDQSIIFFWLVVAATQTLAHRPVPARESAAESAPQRVLLERAV